MDYKDNTPRTRTEKKKQGKRGGPFSAKHVRAQEALMAAAAAANKKTAKGKG
jgi:hypothetical protein